MSHHTKRHGPAPVPPGNQPQAGPASAADPSQQTGGATGGGSPFQDQDAKRRIGDFETAGEHSRQQPSPANDAQPHSR